MNHEINAKNQSKWKKRLKFFFNLNEWFLFFSFSFHSIVFWFHSFFSLLRFFFETWQQLHCSIVEIEKIVDIMISQLHLFLDVRADFMTLIKLKHIALYIYIYMWMIEESISVSNRKIHPETSQKERRPRMRSWTLES